MNVGKVLKEFDNFQVGDLVAWDKDTIGIIIELQDINYHDIPYLVKFLWWEGKYCDHKHIYSVYANEIEKVS